MSSRRFYLWCLICVFGFPHHALAQNVVQDNLSIGVGVLATCQINSTNDIQFGSLDPNQAIDSFAQGELIFACTRGMSYNVLLSQGLNFDSARQTRQMRSDGSSPAYLPYILSTQQTSGIGNGFQNPSRLIINAHIRGIDYRDIPEGAYMDTIRVTFEP